LTTNSVGISVFVSKGNDEFEKRFIVLGNEGQDFVEARSGLNAGECVVTEGIYQLRSVKP
jgi:multidrug efflux pump subunit AcrA (membrane-fusion protein)